MSYCSSCGAEISENQKFCPNCGQKVKENEPVKGDPPSFPATKKKKSKAIIVLATLIMVVIIVVVGTVYKRQKQQQAAVQAAAIELEKKRAAELWFKANQELEQQAAEQAAETKKLAKIAKQRMELEKKRTDLGTNPNKYIKTVGQCNYQVSGIVNVYITVKACTFTNSSDFIVADISGDFHVTTSNGTIKIPFKIPSGFSLSDGMKSELPIKGIEKVKIPGKLMSYRVEILRVAADHPDELHW